MIGQMTIAIALPAFNKLGRSVNPIFLWMDHFKFLFRLSTFSEKMPEEILSTNNLNFFQNASSNAVLCSSSFICATI